MNTDQISKDAVNEDEKINQTLRWLVYFLAAIAGVTLIILLISFRENESRVIISFLSVGGATLFGGAIIGFLFAIPRSGTYRYRPNQENAGSWYDDNTNLEEISDWITKIIVGLTLVQFNKILSLLQNAAQNLAHSLSSDKHQDLPVFYPWAYGAIVFFIASGFAISYLWTRINFALILTVSRRRLTEIASIEKEKEKKLTEIADIEQQKEQLEAVVKSEKSEFLKVTNAVSVSTHENPVKAEKFSLTDKKGDTNKARMQKLIMQSLSKEVKLHDDTQKGRWGGKHQNQGKELYAKVEPNAKLKGLYDVSVRVRSVVPDTTLEGPVAIFVDQTFGFENNYVLVYPDNTGEAKLNLVAYEAFTVGALLPDGTELELDLNQVKGYPSGFYYH